MKKFVSLLIMALVLQAGVYLYLDRVVLVPQVSFTEKTVPGTAKADQLGSYSSDRAYYAQLSPTGLKIFSTSDNLLSQEITLQPNQTITYFSWLANHHLALAGISTDTDQGTSVALKPINLETGSKPVIPTITGLQRGARIADVALSQETNVVNILVRNNTTATVYRTDANNRLRRLNLKTSDIRRIATLHNTVDLFYESPAGGVVYALDSAGRTRRISPPGSKYSLIGVDGSDRVYIGQLNSSNKVSVLMVGDAGGHFRNFANLSQPYSPDAITIGNDGRPTFGST
ncbi:MAG TPA: hypothetical protein VGL40_08925 [Bacillota bacterium]|jgi:hypothetical protein